MNGFEQRRDASFRALMGKGKVPPKDNFLRRRSYSLLDFAFKCLWNDEMNAEANASIVDNCSMYVNSSGEISAEDDYYWVIDELLAVVELYGEAGTAAPGRMTSVAEKAVMDFLWKCTKVNSVKVRPDHLETNTWDIIGSENHHIMQFYALWHASKLLMKSPDYGGLIYDDGMTPSQAYHAWTSYIKSFIRERARKGLFVEFNSEYNVHDIKCFYNIYDYSPDNELRNLAGKLITLFWADWAQEQIGGINGGCRARTYPGEHSTIGLANTDNFFDDLNIPRRMAWYYAAYPEKNSLLVGHVLTVLASSYRLPDLVIDMIKDVDGRGVYENTQRRLGLAKDGMYKPQHYRICQDDGLVRYSYCTPDFVLGSFYCEARPEKDWTMISSQNRWIGAIFRTESTNSRIFVQCQSHSEDQRANYNQFWSVQSKGTLITQKLVNSQSLEYNKHAGALRIWISDEGQISLNESNGWVFVDYGLSYAAIKAVKGSFSWKDDVKENTWSGKWMVLSDESSPVILEIGRKNDYGSFDEFKRKISALVLVLKGDLLEYRTSYGDNLALYTDYSQLPKINGKAVNLRPEKVMDSPFVQSVFNSGICTIRKGARTLKLDFNTE